MRRLLFVLILLLPLLTAAMKQEKLNVGPLKGTSFVPNNSLGVCLEMTLLHYGDKRWDQMELNKSFCEAMNAKADDPQALAGDPFKQNLRCSWPDLIQPHLATVAEWFNNRGYQTDWLGKAKVEDDGKLNKSRLDLVRRHVYLGRPVAIRVGGDHWVLVTGFDEQVKWVLYNDPADGSRGSSVSYDKILDPGSNWYKETKAWDGTFFTIYK